jgi:hypothetical protein
MLNKDYRPSKVEQCVLCPGCLKMCEGIAKTESEYAKEGTMLHDKVAKHDTSNLTSEQQIMVERCFELMKRLAPDETWKHEVELNLVDEDFTEIIKGTADAIVIGDIGILCDWKYGRNPVTASADNWQLKTYACMMFDTYDIEACHCIIFQPRLGNAGFSEVTYSREDLEKFPTTLKEIYRTCMHGISLRAGDKQCKYCEAKATCPEYMRWTGQVSNALAKIEHTHALTTDQLAKALEQTAQVKDFIKQLTAQVSAIENVAREKLIKNEVTPDQIGYQLKVRNGARKCADAQKVFELVHEIIPVEQFMSIVDVSIPDLETLYGKLAKEQKKFKSQKEAVNALADTIAPFIERKSDSYQLVKVEDK